MLLAAQVINLGTSIWGHINLQSGICNLGSGGQSGDTISTVQSGDTIWFYNLVTIWGHHMVFNLGFNLGTPYGFSFSAVFFGRPGGRARKSGEEPFLRRAQRPGPWAGEGRIQVGQYERAPPRRTFVVVGRRWQDPPGGPEHPRSGRGHDHADTVCLAAGPVETILRRHVLEFRPSAREGVSIAPWWVFKPRPAPPDTRPSRSGSPEG